MFRRSWIGIWGPISWLARWLNFLISHIWSFLVGQCQRQRRLMWMTLRHWPSLGADSRRCGISVTQSCQIWDQNWVGLAPNVTDFEPSKISFQYILDHRVQIYWKLVFKSPIWCQSDLVSPQIWHPCRDKWVKAWWGLMNHLLSVVLSRGHVHYW